MKLKELPLSIRTARQLSRISIPTKATTEKPVIPVIVSLTSIPSRLKKLHLVIRSLLNQSYLPEGIVLWLNDELKEQIPKDLQQLEGDFFQIRYSPLTCSHRKLIHSLEAFPEATIVTCDDDVMYRQDWLEKLYVCHLQYPEDIIANQCRVIRYDDEGNTQPYKTWTIKDPSEEEHEFLLPIGCGGVLYPPGSLLAQATDQSLFLELTPKADDLWFKAMSYLKGTHSRRATIRSEKPVPIAGTQKISLKKENIDQDKNRTQWQQLHQHFHLNKTHES